MSRIPIDEALEKYRRLKSLATEINDHHELASLSAEKAIGQANGACQEALLCGQLLMRAKSSLRHGEWQTWLSENCTLSHVTATRYMRGARRSQNTGQSIRQWYITTGILPEPQRPEPGSPLSAALTALALCRMANTFTAKLDLDLIGSWSVDEKQTVLHALSHVHDVWLYLQEP